MKGKICMIVGVLMVFSSIFIPHTSSEFFQQGPRAWYIIGLWASGGALGFIGMRSVNKTADKEREKYVAAVTHHLGE